MALFSIDRYGCQPRGSLEQAVRQISKTGKCCARRTTGLRATADSRQYFLLLHKRPFHHKIPGRTGVALGKTAFFQHGFQVFEHLRAAA